MGRPKLTDAQVLAAIFKRSSPAGCWVYGKTHRYHSVTHNGTTTTAHRYVYKMIFGEIPNGLDVCHHCDNRQCVRPDHLFLGTPTDNSADMVKKGRAATGRRNGKYTHPKATPRGEKTGNAKLTVQDVMKIRSLRSQGLTYQEIGKTFGVHLSTVFYALTKNWRHVHAEV